MKEIKIRYNKCKRTIPDGTAVFGVVFIENGNSQPLEEVDLCPECVSKMKKELLYAANQTSANDTVNNSQNKIQKQQESICDKDRKQKAVQLIKEGKSNKEISDILGSTTNYVAVIRHELKVNGVYPPEKQEQVPEQKQEIIQEKEPVPVPPPTVSRKKLDAAKIRALLRAGWSMEKIARTEFHCTTAEIKEALEEDH